MIGLCVFGTQKPLPFRGGVASASAPQLTANFISLIASELLTQPPIRLVA